MELGDTSSMQKTFTPEIIRAVAQMVDLPLSADEVGPVLERVQSLSESVDQIAHLVDDTAAVDARFDARWEVEQA